MMKKVLITAAALAIFSAVPAMAGEWKYNDVGWYYEYDNGSYASNRMDLGKRCMALL